MTRVLFLVLILVPASEALAYKEAVHRRITSNVFDRVAFDFKERLGIGRDDNVGGKDARYWLQEGAFDEDDSLVTLSVIQRPVNHFFDPVHEVPLSIGVYPACGPVSLPLPLLPERATRADVWSGAHGPQFANRYDIADAREMQRFVLLGSDPSARDVSLKDLFYTLGHVVHLVEDMAQPEHTRNDQHLPMSHVFLSNGTAASLYEEWGMSNLAGIPPPGTPPCNPAPCPALVDLEGYATVKLPTFASYFHTPHRDNAGNAVGKGMADYSNRNFVTQDTNYGDYQGVDRPCFEYPQPLKPVAKRHEVNVRRLLTDTGVCCESVVVLEDVYESPVHDYLTGLSDVDIFHAFESAVDLETLQVDPTRRFYSLADESFQSRAAMLVPRAIGYAAGIVEHFFRGKIEASWQRIGTEAPFSHRMTITNRSSETIGADARISAVYRATPQYFDRTNAEDTGSILRDAELAALAPGFGGLLPGQSVTFTVPQIFGLKPGDSITQFERRIAITGTLGTEPEAVLGLVQPADPRARLRIVFTWDGAPFPNLFVNGRGDNCQAESGISRFDPSNPYTLVQGCSQGTISTPPTTGSGSIAFETFTALKPGIEGLYEVAVSTMNRVGERVVLPRGGTVEVFHDNVLKDARTFHYNKCLAEFMWIDASGTIQPRIGNSDTVITCEY